jgi:hypothetical protein
MTLEERKALYLAWLDGKEIQVFSVGKWHTKSKADSFSKEEGFSPPHFLMNYKYRVKPEPVKKTVKYRLYNCLPLNPHPRVFSAGPADYAAVQRLVGLGERAWIGEEQEVTLIEEPK